MISLALAALLGVLGGVVTVPYVALRPGPTFDTLGSVDGTPVIDIKGDVTTYPSDGHLNMTTVSVVDDITLFGAIGHWFSGREALVPRDDVFPPDLTESEVDERNVKLFQDSESSAERAALGYLGYPVAPSVEAVEVGKPADGKLEPGDLLTAIDGVPVKSTDEVLRQLTGVPPGQELEISFRRGEEKTPRTTTVVPATGPDPKRSYLGIQITDRPDVDFDVTISLADVGGPSAGLMFALSIVDKLTPGPLAGGNFIAGTGEISPTGEVSPIGGIPFKMRKAKEVGAKVFLVPDGNCEEAVDESPGGLRLLRVSTLRSAVDSLTALSRDENPATC